MASVNDVVMPRISVVSVYFVGHLLASPLIVRRVAYLCGDPTCILSPILQGKSEFSHFMTSGTTTILSAHVTTSG